MLFERMEASTKARALSTCSSSRNWSMVRLLASPLPAARLGTLPGWLTFAIVQLSASAVPALPGRLLIERRHGAHGGPGALLDLRREESHRELPHQAWLLLGAGQEHDRGRSRIAGGRR